MLTLEAIVEVRSVSVRQLQWQSLILGKDIFSDPVKHLRGSKNIFIESASFQYQDDPL